MVAPTRLTISDSPRTSDTIRRRVHPMDRSTPNSLMRSKNDRREVFNTPVMAITAARMDPPVFPAEINTKVLSTRPKSVSLFTVANWGNFVSIDSRTCAELAPGASLTNPSVTWPAAW